MGGGFFLNRDPNARRRGALTRRVLDSAKEHVFGREVEENKRNPFVRGLSGLLDIGTRGIAREVLPDSFFRDYGEQERIGQGGGGSSFTDEGEQIPALQGFDQGAVLPGGFRGPQATNAAAGTEGTEGSAFERYLQLPEQTRAATILEHPEDIALFTPAEFDNLFPSGQTLPGKHGQVSRLDPSGQVRTIVEGDRPSGDPKFDTINRLNAIIENGGAGIFPGVLAGSRQAEQAVKLAKDTLMRVENEDAYEDLRTAPKTPEALTAVLRKHSLVWNKDPDTGEQITQAIDHLWEVRRADLERTGAATSRAKQLVKDAEAGGGIDFEKLLTLDRASDYGLILATPEIVDNLSAPQIEQLEAGMASAEAKETKQGLVTEDTSGTLEARLQKNRTNLAGLHLVRQDFADEIAGDEELEKRVGEMEAAIREKLITGGDLKLTQEYRQRRADRVNRMVLAAQVYQSLSEMGPRALGLPGSIARGAANLVKLTKGSQEEADSLFRLASGGEADQATVAGARSALRNLAFSLRQNIILDAGKRISDKEMALIEEAAGDTGLANSAEILGRFQMLMKINLRESVIEDMFAGQPNDFGVGILSAHEGASPEDAKAEHDRTREKLETIGFDEGVVDDLIISLGGAENLVGLFGRPGLIGARSGEHY